MADELNKKVINLFKAHKKSGLVNEAKEHIKYYAGFHYVKLKKDLNGNKFSKEALLSYAEKCHYLVSVMREVDGETMLYSYTVSNEDLFKFMKSFEENTLDGVIIEIDKYFPNGLA